MEPNSHRLRKAVVNGSGGWVRLAEARPVDSAVAAALTDTWVPMPFTYIDESHPIMFPTIELTVHFLDPLPLAGDTGIDPCFVWHRIDTSRSGFVVQDTEVWTRNGRLIARGRHAHSRHALKRLRELSPKLGLRARCIGHGLFETLDVVGFFVGFGGGSEGNEGHDSTVDGGTTGSRFGERGNVHRQ